jgi:anti-sigma factor RsiW
VDTTPEFACQDLVELVTEYLEGALAPDQRADFDAHLVDCPYCDEYLDQIRRTIDLTGTIAEVDLSPAARETLLDAFHDWTHRRTPG